MLELKTVDQRLGQHYAVKGCHNAAFSVKDVSTSSRIVTGFYNTFNYFDGGADVLMSGCAKKTIKENGPKSEAVAKIKHALFHDLTKLPAKIQLLEERTVESLSGIYFEAKMSNTTLGNDTLTNYIEGIYDNHSIGFLYQQVERIEREAKNWRKFLDMLINPEDAEKVGVMYIVKEIQMFEGSTVAFGMNGLTPYLGLGQDAKSANKDTIKLDLFSRINKLQNTLKKGTQSDETMRIFEIQVRQMKQIVEELTDVLPSTKDTSIEKPSAEDANEVDYKLLNENFKLN